MEIVQENAVIPEWSLGDRLRKAREHAGLSQTRLGAEIGVSLASVMRYETGKNIPRRPVLLLWALATGIDLNWLLGRGGINVQSWHSPATRGAWALAA